MATNTQNTQDDEQTTQPETKPPVKHLDTTDAPVPSAAPVSGGEPAPMVRDEAPSADPYAVSPHVEGYAPASNPDSPNLDDTPGITEIAPDATSEQMESISSQNQGPERLNIH